MGGERQGRDRRDSCPVGGDASPWLSLTHHFHSLCGLCGLCTGPLCPHATSQLSDARLRAAVAAGSSGPI